jgi:hypothetical protein
LRSLNIRFACLLLVVGFVEGAVAGRFYRGPSVDAAKVFIAVVNTFLVFVWYRNDSIARSYWPPRLLSIAMAGATILALPYYLFRTRGFKGGLSALGLLLLTLILYGIWTGLVQYYFIFRGPN